MAGHHDANGEMPAVRMGVVATIHIWGGVGEVFRMCECHCSPKMQFQCI